MKREFMRRAKASPSDAGTCRENSWAGVKKGVRWRWRTTDLVNLVANDDLDHGFGDVSFELTVPPREGLKGLPVGDVVHWTTVEHLS